MDALADVPVDPRQDVEFDRAFELLRELVDLDHADDLQPLGPNAIYLASTVLWLLVYQRLEPRAP